MRISAQPGCLVHDRAAGLFAAVNCRCAILGVLLALILSSGGWRTWAAEVIPPAPSRYFNDYANVIPPATAQSLNRQLEDFERQSSSQIVVGVYPKMQSDSSIEDYTVRVAQSWRVGQKAKDNGAVLFVFIQDRKMYLQVGYGLEGAIPDAIAKRIIEDEIKPHFRSGDYAGGLSAGVAAIMAAARGEYQGTGRTAAEGGRRGNGVHFVAILAIVGVFLLLALVKRAGGRSYSRRGYSRWGGWGGWGGGGWTGGSWGGGGGGGWSGGGGGGGFSGGGGSFGGGGAGGSW